MTQEFQDKVNRIPNAKIQTMLYTPKYRDNIKAAEAAFDTWETLMKDFQDAIEIIEEMNDKLDKALEDNKNFREYFEELEKHKKGSGD